MLQEDADDILADNAEDLGGEDLGGSAAHYRCGAGTAQCGGGGAHTWVHILHVHAVRDAVLRVKREGMAFEALSCSCQLGWPWQGTNLKP